MSRVEISRVGERAAPKESPEGFKIGRKNDSEFIRGLKSLNGRLLGSDFFNALATDNEIVLGLGLTHKKVAKKLWAWGGPSGHRSTLSYNPIDGETRFSPLYEFVGSDGKPIYFTRLTLSAMEEYGYYGDKIDPRTVIEAFGAFIPDSIKAISRSPYNSQIIQAPLTIGSSNHTEEFTAPRDELLRQAHEAELAILNRLRSYGPTRVDEASDAFLMRLIKSNLDDFISGDEGEYVFDIKGYLKKLRVRETSRKGKNPISLDTVLREYAAFKVPEFEEFLRSSFVNVRVGTDFDFTPVQASLNQDEISLNGTKVANQLGFGHSTILIVKNKEYKVEYDRVKNPEGKEMYIRDNGQYGFFEK